MMVKLKRVDIFQTKEDRSKYSMMLHVHFKLKGPRVLTLLIMYLETLHSFIL